VPSCSIPILRPIVPFTPQTALYQEKQRPIAREVTHLRAESDISDAKAKLEVLRKGCCHPQVWDKDLARRKGQGMARPFDEIMILKVEHSRLACEEKQRELVFHLNSLAGVAMLQAQLQITEGAVYRMEDRAMDVDVDGGAFLGGVSSPFLRTGNTAADLSAADYLRRAMRAFGSAYSCLERNRQTCPLLGLVRLSGTPEGVFRVTRLAEGEEFAEKDRNLVNTELRADCLCLSWSCRLPLEGEGGSDTGEEEVCFSAVSLPSVGAPVPSSDPSAHGQSLSSPVPSPSSLQAERIFSVCGYRAPVSARMAFGAGRRLQKLRMRSRASVLIAEMRSRLVSSGGRVQEAVLLFPCETSLSAATGIADAFTRVALFDLALPCLPTLSSSDRRLAGAGAESDFRPPSNGPGPGPDDSCGPFPLDPHCPLSTQSVQDFPLTIRARSWRLDVRSVHGWCLEIKIEAVSSCSKRGQGEGEGEGDPDGEGRGSVVTGQWRRTATLLTHPQARPSTPLSITAGPRTCSTVSMSLCMEVEVFEAAFDVDLFQVKIGIPPCHCRLLLLHVPPLIALPTTNCCLFSRSFTYALISPW
jgi:hypothetical protein